MLILYKNLRLQYTIYSFCTQIKNIQIPEHLLDIKYVRSSGPGGQHVNKTNSKAEIRFNIQQAGWIQPEVKQKLQKKFKQYINNDGELIITNQESRDSNQNLKNSIEKLQNMIYECSIEQKERKYDIPPETQQMARKRIDQKRKSSQTKQFRNVKFD